MADFVFRYEKILKLREDEEEQCKNALAMRLREVHEQQRDLGHLLEKQEHFKQSAEEEIAQGCTVLQLRVAESERKWIAEAIENKRFMIMLKENEVRDARLKLGEASKKKKIMEKLKENELIQYEKEAELAEELMTDQIVTFSSSRGKNQ